MLNTKVPAPGPECWVAATPLGRPQLLPMSSSRDSAPPATVPPGTCTRSRDWPKCVGWGWAGAASSPASTAQARGLGSGRPASSDDARSLPCGAGRLTTGGIQGDGRALQILNQDRRTLGRAPATPPPTHLQAPGGWAGDSKELPQPSVSRRVSCGLRRACQSILLCSKTEPGHLPSREILETRWETVIRLRLAFTLHPAPREPLPWEVTGCQPYELSQY